MSSTTTRRSGAVKAMQISEFAAWLRSRTNRNRRPFQKATVLAYTDAARSLGRWMTEQDFDADFTGCDTAMLNRFFTGWVTAHGQTGLNTRQRNLRHLFTWLEEATSTLTPTPARCTGTRR